MAMHQNAVNIFLSYDQEDEVLLRQLESHLSALKQQGLISIWHNRDINAGYNRAQEIDEHLNKAQIILLLVSANFLASDDCQVEMGHALARSEDRKAVVIPIVVSPCDWRHTPLARLQHLPQGKKAVTEWDNGNQAWEKVTTGIRQAIGSLRQENVPNERLPLPDSPHVAIPQKPKLSSRQFLILSLLTIVFIVAAAEGGLWGLAAHNQTPTPSITPTLFPETRLTMAKAAPTVYNDALNNPANQDTAVAAWDITTQCSFSSSGYRTTTYERKPAFCHERNNTYQDAFISVDAVIVSGASAGLLFRDQFSSNASGAYFFEVGSNGKYKISTVPFAVQRTLKNWTQASAIRTGQGVKNTLQVIAQGNTLFFYINGSFLTEELDGKYRNGSLSFACYTGSSSETEAIFSNLEVHKLS